VPVRQLAICVGAVETARMLLQPNESLPHGLGNESGHVGRHFQDHANGVIGKILPTNASSRHSEISKWYSVFYKNRSRYLPRLVMSPSSQRDDQTLNACALPTFDWAPESLTESLKQLQASVAGRRFDTSARSQVLETLKDPGGLYRTLRARAKGRSFAEAPSSINLHVHLEQDPSTSNFVSLSHNKDLFGRPQAKVSWGIGEFEIHTARRMADATDRFLRENNLGEIVLSPTLSETTASAWEGLLSDNQHHAGTSRMSISPNGGVVDRNGKIWGVQNVYISGGAVFPSSSYANPTLTMMAFSFRLGAHLAKLGARQP